MTRVLICCRLSWKLAVATLHCFDLHDGSTLGDVATAEHSASSNLQLALTPELATAQCLAPAAQHAKMPGKATAGFWTSLRDSHFQDLRLVP